MRALGRGREGFGKRKGLIKDKSEESEGINQKRELLRETARGGGVPDHSVGM